MRILYNVSRQKITLKSMQKVVRSAFKPSTCQGQNLKNTTYIKMCALIQLCLSTNCLSAKCAVGEMSGQVKCLSAKCPSTGNIRQPAYRNPEQSKNFLGVEERCAFCRVVVWGSSGNVDRLEYGGVVACITLKGGGDVGWS